MSTAARVVSLSCDFEDSVLASRFSSCIRKSRRRPGGLGRIEHRDDFVQVAAEPVELLVDVHLVRVQDQLLFEPLDVGRDTELRDALDDALAHALRHFRQSHLDHLHVGPHRSAAREQQLADSLPFAMARFVQLSQRLAQQLEGGDQHRLRVQLGFAHYARPAQQFQRADRRW